MIYDPFAEVIRYSLTSRTRRSELIRLNLVSTSYDEETKEYTYFWNTDINTILSCLLTYWPDDRIELYKLIRNTLLKTPLSSLVDHIDSKYLLQIWGNCVRKKFDNWIDFSSYIMDECMQ